MNTYYKITFLSQSHELGTVSTEKTESELTTESVEAVLSFMADLAERLVTPLINDIVEEILG